MVGMSTDGIEGIKLVSNEDGLVMVQIRNNTNFDMFLVPEKTQDFKNKGVQIPSLTQWPTNGPTMYLGDLWIFSDSGSNKQTFAVIKSAAISRPQIKRSF